MKWIPAMLLALATAAQAQIYRCETADGVEFSDEPCGKDATVVHLEEATSGISGGPPEVVRQQLADKKAQRAEDREKRLEALARAPQPAPAPPVIIQQPVFYPGYWWRPNLPPHHRPLPGPPKPPPPDRGNPVLRPLD
jgi:hypothetical protein